MTINIDVFQWFDVQIITNSVSIRTTQELDLVDSRLPSSLIGVFGHTIASIAIITVPLLVVPWAGVPIVGVMLLYIALMVSHTHNIELHPFHLFRLSLSFFLSQTSLPINVCNALICAMCLNNPNACSVLVLESYVCLLEVMDVCFAFGSQN